MKIKLVSFYNRFYEYPTKYSLGTLRLASYMGKNKDLDIGIIPIDSEEEISNKTINKLVEDSPEIIGIPNFMWTEQKAKKISEEVKKINPNIIRVIGGPSTADVIFEDWQSDEIFVLGEGEEALLKICEEKLENPAFNAEQVNQLQLENVFSENADALDRHVIYTNTTVPKGIPLFSEEIENMKEDKEKEEFAWYETTRGCAYNCGYCGHKTRNNLGYIDLENVEQEIKNIKKQGISRLFIVDPIIGGTKENGKRVLKMCNEEIPDTKIIAYLRPEMLDDEYVDILADCNLEEMRFGIQTLNPEVPGWVRSNSINKIQRELSKLYGKKVNWRAELIVGLPGDNMEGLRNSIKTVINEFQPTVLAGYHLTAIKGTRLYNLVDGTDNEKWLKINKDSQVTESYSFTKEEFKEMAQYAVLTTSLYNVLKRIFPDKLIDYDKLMNYIQNNMDENIDYERIEQFDTRYAEQYWKSKLKELKHEKTHNSKTWRVDRKSEEDYTR